MSRVTIQRPREWVWVLTLYIIFFLFLAVTAQPYTPMGRMRDTFYAYLEGLAQRLPWMLEQAMLKSVKTYQSVEPVVKYIQEIDTFIRRIKHTPAFKAFQTYARESAGQLPENYKRVASISVASLAGWLSMWTLFQPLQRIVCFIQEMTSDPDFQAPSEGANATVDAPDSDTPRQGLEKKGSQKGRKRTATSHQISGVVTACPVKEVSNATDIFTSRSEQGGR